MGEFGFLQHISPQFKKNLPLNVEGIGDDCAVIPFQNSLSYLVTTDLLIEDIHFILNKITPHQLGYRSLAVNISDIAAMGGTPHYAFLSLALPIHLSIEWLDAFFEGIRDLASQNNIFLLGGDTTRSEKIVINLLLIGTQKTATIKKRSHAQIGDVICCTGNLGDSGAGLKLLLDGRHMSDLLSRKLIDHHLHPQPHLSEGKWLAEQEGVHAMIDISDGLSSDIQRIMEESKCGAHIRVELLPLSQELVQVSKVHRWSAEQLALSGGEDYCLLITVDPTKFSSIKDHFAHTFSRPLYEIGTIETSSLLFTFHQKSYILQKSGFDHFKK